MQLNSNLWSTFTTGALIIGYRPLTLHLKRKFTTAHSSLSTRTNFLVEVHFEDMPIKGFGQTGIPPKKPHCYFADYTDCQHFMQNLEKQLTTSPETVLYDLFQTIPQNYFASCRPHAVKNSVHCSRYSEMLNVLGKGRQMWKHEWRAAYNALQFAVFDLWAKLQQKSVTELIFGSTNLVPGSKHYSFYTLSYEQQQQMIQNAINSLHWTRYIKIKYIDDIKNLLHLLQQLEQRTNGQIVKYIIDANASWSAESAAFFVQQMETHQFETVRNKILYIQQPFPLVISEGEFAKWQGVKNSTQIKIVADQSFFGEQTIEYVKPLCSGVNIKTQKVGGAINSVKSAICAQNNQLEIMLGSMVSTHLSCTQTFALHPFAQFLDVDGALLVDKPCIKGGFIWGQGGQVLSPEPQIYGLEIKEKQLQIAIAESELEHSAKSI